MKPGIVSYPKIKLPAKRWLTLTVLAAWAISLLACAWGPEAVTPVPTYDLGIGGMDTPNAETPQITPSVQFLAYTPAPTKTATVPITPRPPLLYTTQAGDSLNALAIRFGVSVDQIECNQALPAEGFIDPGQLLVIPDVLPDRQVMERVMPDSEVVYSATALDFDLDGYVAGAGGYLSSYREYLSDGWYDGAQVVKRVAQENSINPRLLLAIIEYQSHWVTGQPQSLAETNYPAGNVDFSQKGLYHQLTWAARQMSLGYYGWRLGTVTILSFPNSETRRLWPELNAGTVGLLYLFSQIYEPLAWAGAVYGTESLSVRYEEMFDSPWQRAQTVEPLLPAGFSQPPMELPFAPGLPWVYTGGPHPAWGTGTPMAALDFAPPSDERSCEASMYWITAAAPGLVTRSDNGLVVVDLDGDGSEQTGWVILYLHIATMGRVPVGEWLDQDEQIGHPSCEGGSATGRHVHMARKYNGEWMPADSPAPFVLSGWRAVQGEKNYEGLLIKDGVIVTASTVGSVEAVIVRTK